MEMKSWSDHLCKIIREGTPSSTIAPVQGAWHGTYHLDTITGLVAFPCFLECFATQLRILLRTYGSVGIAIGDVDHLKSFVETSNRENPLLFGHLVGNAFMSRLGYISLSVFEQLAFSWRCLATFGGDEIIVVCAGSTRLAFHAAIDQLAQELAAKLPRTVSFAQGWFSIEQDTPDLDQMDRVSLCLSPLALVDHALFAAKQRRGCTDQHQHVPIITTLKERWLYEKQWQRAKRQHQRSSRTLESSSL